MLPMYKRHNVIWLSLVALFGSVLLSTPAFADDIVVNHLNAQDMLKNIGLAVPDLMRLVTAFAYVVGMVFIIIGVIEMKHLGEMRTQMSHEHSLKKPLMFLLSGSLLLYLPTAVQVGMNTFFEVPNPYGYETESGQWADLYNDVFLVIQLFGTIAFIRGLIILSHLGGHGQQNSLGKGLTHIIGGLFCINIYQFVQVVLATLGVHLDMG